MSRCPGAGFLRGSEGLRSSTKSSLKSCSQSSKSCNRSLCTSSRPSCFCFRCLAVYAGSFPVPPHSYFHFFRLRDFPCTCRRQTQSPEMKMSKKYVWLMYRNLSTNQVNEWHIVRYVAINVVALFWWVVVFDRWSNGRYTLDPLQSFARERTAGVSPRNNTATNKSNSLTYTVASSLVCTSPSAVITVIGLLDVLMVSNSAESRSPSLTICILAPESTTKSLFSRSFIDVTGNTHSSEAK